MASGSDTVNANKKEQNYIRLNLLVVKLSTFVLKARFDHVIQPNQLHQKLNQFTKTINYGRNKKIISRKQYDLLFPNTSPAQSEKFDITLLVYLLRHICGFDARSKWWKENDNTKIPDTVEEEVADIVRIRNVRNEIQHLQKASVEQEDFDAKWSITEEAMLRLGTNCNLSDLKDDIETIKKQPFELVKEKTLRILHTHGLDDDYGYLDDYDEYMDENDANGFDNGYDYGDHDAEGAYEDYVDHYAEEVLNEDYDDHYAEGVLNEDYVDHYAEEVLNEDYVDHDAEEVLNEDYVDHDAEGVLNEDYEDHYAEGVLNEDYGDHDAEGAYEDYVDHYAEEVLNEDYDDHYTEEVLNEDYVDHYAEEVLNEDYVDHDAEGVLNEDYGDHGAEGVLNEDYDDHNAEGVLNEDYGDHDAERVLNEDYGDHAEGAYEDYEDHDAIGVLDENDAGGAYEDYDDYYAEGAYGDDYDDHDAGGAYKDYYDEQDA